MPHKRDHPRVCGEKRFHLAHGLSVPGSPPRMRGKVTLLYALADREGITPAYAGKSLRRIRLDRVPRDHPRVCGEKPGSKQPENPHQGSPPRMRGKGARCHAVYAEIGITPAYAGKRREIFLLYHVGEDHPRVCGEKSFKTSTSCGYKGSPPRMRGKGGAFYVCCSFSGITPAYAGKSQTTRRVFPVLRDHPRVCGEKWLPYLRITQLQGSPPRMRGKD